MYEDFTSTGVDGLLKACASDGFKRGEQAGLAHQAEAVRELRAALAELRESTWDYYIHSTLDRRLEGGDTMVRLLKTYRAADRVLACYPDEPKL